MTEQICECGHRKNLHAGERNCWGKIEKGLWKEDCQCKKFTPKKGLDKKSKGCGKEGVDDYGFIITCGKEIFCDACSKARNHSPSGSGERSPTEDTQNQEKELCEYCLLYTSPSPRDRS